MSHEPRVGALALALLCGGCSDATPEGNSKALSSGADAAGGAYQDPICEIDEAYTQELGGGQVSCKSRNPEPPPQGGCCASGAQALRLEAGCLEPETRFLGCLFRPTGCEIACGSVNGVPAARFECFAFEENEETIVVPAAHALPQAYLDHYGMRRCEDDPEIVAFLDAFHSSPGPFPPCPSR